MEALRNELARNGAMVRLQAIEQEITAISAMFPDLPVLSVFKPKVRKPIPPPAPPARRRPRWSAAKRRKVSARMKKYWQARKRAEREKAAAKAA